MPYQKVTPIEDLVPDIDDVDGSGINKPNHMLSPQQTQLSRRFIRKNSVMMPESGMLSNPYEQFSYGSEPAEPPASIPQNNVFRNSSIIEFPSQPQFQPPQMMQPHVFSCQDIFYHIESCPLCKKFYKQDNTVYLIIIAILVLACALLIKKVLSE
uniref:Uncharacterized protein n=1 Tax=viral metagenome TaxID=1070528 RepID=A0A6C0KPS6_9ZZZZ